MNPYAKLTAAGALFASLLYLVITGKMSPGDYQTLAVGALGALGGYHAGAGQKTANPTQPPKEG